MSEQGRIRRSLRRAEAAFQQLANTRNPEKQQEAWEEFLVSWRQSIELTRHYAEQANLLAISERRHKERLSDPILDYAWEARNAEYHDSQGSADPHPGGVIVTANDPSEAIAFHNVTIVNGTIIQGRMSNAVITREPPSLAMKPVARKTKKGQDLVAPPKSKSPKEICEHALKFATGYLNEVIKAS